MLLLTGGVGGGEGKEWLFLHLSSLSFKIGVRNLLQIFLQSPLLTSTFLACDFRKCGKWLESYLVFILAEILWTICSESYSSTHNITMWWFPCSFAMLGFHLRWISNCDILLELLKNSQIKSNHKILAIFKGTKLYPPCIWNCQPTL